MANRTVGYCTPEDVVTLMGLTDPITMEPLVLTDKTFPKRADVQNRILINSDKFDAQVQDTWGTNTHANFVFDRGSLWWTTNTYITCAPLLRGGWQSQLLGPIKTWDTSKGDKLEIRTEKGNFVDISDELGSSFWFDYEGGNFYWLKPTLDTYAEFRITYRYGQNEDPPLDVQDAVAKMTAIHYLTADWYRTKIAGGGDLQGKDGAIREWKEDIKTTMATHLNCGYAVDI